jgi:hypothetical protein
MPRITTSTTEVIVPRASMVSSAANVNGVGFRNYRKFETWQQECWYFRDTVGELRYAVSWFANALSRALIKPATYNAEGALVPQATGPAVDALAIILGGLGGQSQMLKAMGEHFFVAGEWYIVGRAAVPSDDVDEDTEEVWEVVSSESMKKKGDRWWIDYGDGQKYEVKTDDVVFRAWNPHPRSKNSPDSAVRAILPTLAEIENLSKHLKAQIRSRLAGAGVLFISNETTFSTPNPDNEGTNAAEGADPFMVALGGAMSASIVDIESPEALVPIIARVPGDQVDKIKHLTFWTELDGKTADLRNEAIRRAALGIDLPPEVLLGTADVNHWGSWQIEESTIKAHIEPALEVIAAVLTRILRKITEDPELICVFDTSALRLRPNRSKEALELWDRGEISAEALRRETGFSEADDPMDEERKAWYLRKIASGSASPEQVEAALNLLGIPLVTATPGDNMRESRPDPSLMDHPQQGLPQTEREADAERAALEATCDALVFRALERAGNRIKNRSKARPEGIETQNMHLYVRTTTAGLESLLEGAWTTLPQLMRNQRFNCERVQRALDAYVRSLIMDQQQHDPDMMMRYVDAAVKEAAA